jgi:hypothetical protein
MADKLSLPDLAAAVVAQDEDIRDSLKGLVQDMIKHMRYTMRHGDPSAKTALSKQIIPQLLNGVHKVDSDAGEAEERAAYKRLMSALAGDAPVEKTPDKSPEATEDAPTVQGVRGAKPPVRKLAAKKVVAKKVAAKKAS